jgi:KDO2-lipid IV(A) lauroyltransferase
MRRRRSLWRSLPASVRLALRLVLAPFAFAAEYTAALVMRAIVRGLKRLDPDASSAMIGRSARRIGPWLPVSRIGRENLRAAFPEKSEQEIEEILSGVWENLGRVAGEFVHLEKLWDYDDARPNAGRVETFHVDRFIELFADGKPALIFSAHLANWELGAVGMRRYGLDSAVLFHVPNNRFMADFIRETRSEMMSQLVPSGSDAGLFVGGVMQRGGHLAMLVDQRSKRGARVNFFGRDCWSNTTIARLARRYDCPVHGARVIRLPQGRFRIEMTKAVDLPRDAEGLVDVHAATQKIAGIIERWIREYPEQWLWLHNRWR